MTSKSAVNSFCDLLVWQKAMLAVKQVYVLTRQFPVEERYGLISAELETHLQIAIDLKYCSAAESDSLFNLLEEIRKMLNSLRRRLQGL